MKIVVFVMILTWPGGQFPIHEEPMDLEQCLERVKASTADFMKTDETFKFVAGCRIESKKAEPV